jgi:ABC-2 type transport system permease protein
MRDLGTVFGFELRNKLKAKTVRITTIIILAIILIATFIPTIISIFNRGLSNENVKENENLKNNIVENNTEEKGDIVLINTEYGYVIENNAIDQETIKTLYPFSHSKAYSDEEALRNAVKQGNIKKGILIKSPTSYLLIANDLSMHDMSMSIISDVLLRYNRNNYLIKEGIDPSKVDEAEGIIIQGDTVILGKNAITGFVFAYIGMFIIYSIIILYGNSVATSVAREKNDRTMELLITSTSSNNLIWGKVLASTVVSTGQLVLMILVAVAGFLLNQNYYPDFIVRIIQEGISISSLLIFIIFALVGTLMYYFLYASVGALVSKVEEVNSAMTPIQFVFIGAFLLCSISLNIPDGLLMRVISIVPFTSPMAMFIRYSMTTVPLIDLICALILLIITLYLLSHIAIKIYRMGTLNYGNKMGFFKALRLVLKSAR